MKKGCLFLFIGLLTFSLLNISVVLAEEDFKDELFCVPCGDSCYPSDQVATTMCVPPTAGKPECGIENGECVVLDFEDDSEDDEIYEGYEDAELEEDAGTMPGSPFYFIDRFFDRFGDELTVKEERIAEIKALIEEGDIEGAKEVLKDYMELADELEHEIGPDRREDAKRSAAAIRNAMKDIRDKLPPGERGEFVSEIMRKEHSIATAAEIAGKIKELCTQLAELDPMEYSRMCKTDDDDPKWQKKLDKDLSKEQEKIAREFVGVMKECFESSGQDCRCQDIPFTDFADACSVAAPLAAACDVDGDERACEKLDELEMPELPDWLQDIWEELEEGMMESQFDMHMPKECVEAGATTPKECGKIMIETNAPEECKQPLLDSGCNSERECGGICDKIMMEIHAPECAKEGITNPRECEKFMMPPECRERELGPRECRDYMSNRDNFRGPGPTGINFNCREIQNAEERLKCFDQASSQTMASHGGFDDENYDGPCMTHNDWENKKKECKDLYGENAGDKPIYGDSGNGYECTIDAKCIDFSQGKLDFEEIREREKECANMCQSQNKAWDFSYGECKCYDEAGKFEGPTSGDYEGGVSCYDCASQCDVPSGQRLAGTACGPNGCECYYESDEPQYDEGEGSGDYSGQESEDTGSTTTTLESNIDSITGTTETEDFSNSMTGGVIFLDYYS